LTIASSPSVNFEEDLNKRFFNLEKNDIFTSALDMN
jgi:hypothetical protein